MLYPFELRARAVGQSAGASAVSLPYECDFEERDPAQPSLGHYLDASRLPLFEKGGLEGSGLA
jgi:hypothetical protein